MTLDRVTATEIEDMGFTTRWLRPGYDETEVDLVLDQVADTLTVHEANADTIQQLCGQALRDSLHRGPTDPTRRLAMQILTILDEPDLINADGEAVA